MYLRHCHCTRYVQYKSCWRTRPELSPGVIHTTLGLCEIDVGCLGADNVNTKLDFSDLIVMYGRHGHRVATLEIPTGREVGLEEAGNPSDVWAGHGCTTS